MVGKGSQSVKAGGISKVVCLFSILFVALASVMAGCSGPSYPLPDHLGAKIYHGAARGDVKCHRCHGNLGEGGRGPMLTHAAKTLSPEDFIKVVLDGRNNMPPFRSALTEAEVLAIMDWLKKIPSG